MTPARCEMLGIHFDVVTEQQTCDKVLEQLQLGNGGILVTANLDYLRRTQLDPEFAEFVRGADLIVADGMPLIWASRLQKTPLPERVAGSSLCQVLAADLAQAHRSLFLLGGNPGVAERAAACLHARFPSLTIAGCVCPAWGFEQDPAQMEEIRQQLRLCQPDVVYVALGSPKTERLIAQLRDDLQHAWWIGVGISLSFITGEVKRAPRWLQGCGLEWLHRLAQEPRRLGRRYLIDGIPFAFRLLITSAWKGVRSPASDSAPGPSRS